jgi:hypothetical protein
MSMISLNFLNSIKSTCAATRCRYILLEVDYFNRFVWARFYVYCTMIESTNSMNNLITFIFEWFKTIYFDNEKHFIEFEFEKLLKARNVIHFTTSINSSSSIELIKKMIQLMIKNIKKKCIQRRNSKVWTFNIIDETIAINIRKIKMHEHKSCDIMLKFISKIIHHDINSVKSFVWRDEMKNLFEHAQNILMTTRTKNKILTLKIMTRYQNEKKASKKNVKTKSRKKIWYW